MGTLETNVDNGPKYLTKIESQMYVIDKNKIKWNNKNLLVSLLQYFLLN